jgi:hypothetical protein
MRFVPTKTVEQQSCLMLHRQQTAVILRLADPSSFPERAFVSATAGARKETVRRLRIARNWRSVSSQLTRFRQPPLPCRVLLGRRHIVISGRGCME